MHHITGLALLCVLPVAVGQPEPAPENAAMEICRNLVNDALEVDRLLRTVSDKESGIAAAAQLRTLMERMRQAAERLGRLPLESTEAARLLVQTMRDLTHVTQGYMPVVQLLTEVNAYGADELLDLFRFYKMSAPDGAANRVADESPLVRSYVDWCDSIDDVLYLLRRVQNPDTAAAISADLRNALQKCDARYAQVERLRGGLSPQQQESEQVPVERLLRLRTELRGEIARIRTAGCYGVEALNSLLDACNQAVGH